MEGQGEDPHPVSCDKTRARWQKILIDSTVGREMIRLTDKAGQVVVMNAAAGRERIQATDKSGSVILMDGVMGNIIVRSSNKVLINT